MCRIRSFSTLLSALSSVIVAFMTLSSPAHATCLTTCKADLTFDDCTVPPMATWPQGTPLSFTSSCETCCSAPGGPASCSPAPVDVTTYGVSDEAFNPVVGTITSKNKKCSNTDLFGFDGMMKLGPHNLVAENLIIAQFNVIESPMGTGGTGGNGSMGGSGGSPEVGGAGGMAGNGSSTSSGSLGGAPGQGGNGNESSPSCVVGKPSSPDDATSVALIALAFSSLVAGRRRHR